jgi:hypothetical protein
VFGARHCFWIERGPRDHAEWIGISFKPINDADSLVDIAGTLWFNQATAELRRLDFTYAHLHYVPLDACVRTGLSRREKSCIPPQYITNEGTGGTLAFAYLRTGEWLVNRWTILSPAEEYVDRPTEFRIRIVRGRSEDCQTGPDCERVEAITPRLGVNSGAVVSIARDGAEIYRNDTTVLAVSRIASKQAGKAPANLTGVIVDANGRPLSRAVVSTESPARAAITNDSGYFEIRTLPATQIGVTVRKVGYGPLAFNLPLLADSTRRIRVTLVAVPPAHEE